jgi:hypothetical protein
MAVGNFCFWLAETLKICKDETIGPNDFWHIANDICEVYFKDSTFNLVSMKNIVAMDKFCLRYYKLAWTQTGHA